MNFGIPLRSELQCRLDKQSVSVDFLLRNDKELQCKKKKKKKGRKKERKKENTLEEALRSLVTAGGPFQCGLTPVKLGASAFPWNHEPATMV
jgi:hypothetical protein